MLTKLLERTGWGEKAIGIARIAVLAVIGLAVLLTVLQVRSCITAKRDAAQLKVGKAQAKAFAASATDAIGTIGAVAERERAGEDLTRSNEKEIRNAEGASDPVPPAVHDAGLHALCRRKAYRDSEQCRVRAAPPR